VNLLPCVNPDSALFLDFDGTLAELAPSPAEVHVAPDLVPTLWALAERLNGALAIVTGRPVEQIDAYLRPLLLPVAGVHGAQRRMPGEGIETIVAPSLDAVVTLAQELALRHPGLIVERKGVAMALHYRLAPELGVLCLQRLVEAVEFEPGLELIHGKMVLEVKPSGISKGRAIEYFMGQEPFAGRQPIFIGDDETDESGFEVVQRQGGHAIKMGEGTSLAQHRMTDPATLRLWLQSAVVRLPQVEPLDAPLAVPALQPGAAA
jgi:trehalose 6-phosphate phosphatase